MMKNYQDSKKVEQDTIVNQPSGIKNLKELFETFCILNNPEEY